RFADASVDFVFIDAGHDFNSVCNDIRVWLPKVKPGGVLAGHDYEHPCCPDVSRAVEKMLGQRFEKRPGHVWSHCVELHPLVSVITPTHGRVDRLSRAMESVRSQTYPRIEHIVIGDGPQDDKVAKVVARFPNARYHELRRNWQS